MEMTIGLWEVMLNVKLEASLKITGFLHVETTLVI
jgi:hypothetical protein